MTYRDPMSPEYAQEAPDNENVKAAFAEYDGPWHLYRATYKYTDCGPSVGFCLLDPEGQIHNVYCDSIPESWKEWDDKGWLVCALSVSSIVEGIDACTETIVVPVSRDSTPEQIKSAYYAAVEEVNAEANSLWQETHGCPTCALHWWQEFEGEDPHNWQGADDPRWRIGETQVWTECPECGGSGTCI
jgi:hypothetical protein